MLKGLGTIVSGIPRAGCVKIGDEVELLPDGTRHIVKGIQAYGVPAERGRAGECVALRLSNITTEVAQRGKVVAATGYFKPSRFLNVKFFYLQHHEKPLEPRTAIRFHVGTSDTPGHLVLSELARLTPGSETYAQIQLSKPVVAAPGDFFVLRLLSPVKTLGGGTVIDNSDSKLRRGRGNWLEGRMEKEKAVDDETLALMLALKTGGASPCHIDNWARQANVTKEVAQTKAVLLVQEKEIIEFAGDRYITAEALNTVIADLVKRLTELHVMHPLYRGFEKKGILKGFSGTRMVIDRAFERLFETKQIVHEQERIYLSDQEPILSADEQRASDQLAHLFMKAEFVTPRPDELPTITGLKQSMIDELLIHLRHRNILVELAEHIFIHHVHLEKSKQILCSHLEKQGRIRLAEYKDLLNTSRKFAVPLMEYWDKAGLTKRVGDDRVLK